MVDLNEFVGDAVLRKSIENKRNKANAKLAMLVVSRVEPLEKEVLMYDNMLKAMDGAINGMNDALVVRAVASENVKEGQLVTIENGGFDGNPPKEETEETAIGTIIQTDQ